MIKLSAVIFVLFLLKHIHCISFWDALRPDVLDVTLEKGKPIHLPKNYTAVRFGLLNGTIYSDSFSQLGVSKLRISVADVIKIEDGALCSSPTVKVLDIHFFTTNATPAHTKSIFENCDQLEHLVLGGLYEVDNGTCQIDHNALESLSGLKGLHFTGCNVTRWKKDFLKIPNTVTSLSFEFSGIQEIDSDLFEGLNNLETIEIIFNEKLKKIPKGLFKNTPKLKTLSLGGNEIQDLSWDEFEGLSNLEELNIGENKISYFDAEKIATNFPNLKNLSINLYSTPCNEKEAFVDQLKNRLKTLVEVKYNSGRDSCKRD